MHRTNALYWKSCKKKYNLYFKDPSEVLEFGSYDINGSIIQFFNCKEYIGIDWRPGPKVDIVSLAHEFKSNKKFDTIASASMLEHDPHWDLSLKNMIEHMKDSGIMILTWGAALNNKHCLNEAPDKAFHALKAGLVINLLEKENLYIHEFKYERNLPYFSNDCGSGGLGEVCLVAFKNSINSIGNKDIDPLKDQDK